LLIKNSFVYINVKIYLVSLEGKGGPDVLDASHAGESADEGGEGPANAYVLSGEPEGLAEFISAKQFDFQDFGLQPRVERPG
jgi:hypothetical protein